MVRRSDGISMAILRSELVAMYEALRAGQQTPELPLLPIQYIDFAAWQRSRLERDLDVQARSSMQADVLDSVCRIVCP